MALDAFDVRPITYSMAMRAVIRHHYLHRKAPCSRAFGLFLGWEMKGVICYGTPSSAPLRRGLAGPDHATNVVELTRLWVCDSVPRNGESFLIGRTLPLAGKEYVVSYADTAEGHIGVVYQATNWIYTGLSAKRTNWTIEGDARHCQSIADAHTAEQVRALHGDKFSLQPRSRKHRYVYINARGRRRRELAAALRYPVLPYPKAGDVVPGP